jgi:RHS repeat-associated protein
MALGGRTSDYKYSQPDNVRQKFTSYERDIESDLDYAQARFYRFSHGRFTSPDTYKIVAEVQAETDPEKAKAMLVRYLMQPQQWNQYPYAVNNPLKYIDPTGEIVELTGTEEEQKAALARIRAMLGEERFALVKQSTVNGKIQLTIDSNNIYKFAGIGNDSNNKEFSEGMAGILADKRVAEFRIAEKFEYKDKNGKTHTGYTGTGCFISYCSNGGVTLRPSENASGNGNYQIFVHPDAGRQATIAAAGNWDIAGGEGSLESTNDMVDAHEFGHISEIWRPRFQAIPKPGERRPLRDSLVFENAIRSRYPSPLRRTKH